ELYSGKHKTTGMNVQVACTITGCLAWISDPIPGNRHDNHCLGESGVLVSFDPRNWILRLVRATVPFCGEPRFRCW
ncbi:MAG TPA: transposase family protein, partial [Mycobacterium sp.]|nr:transposase family protein [Mycobacterium sp.]